MKKKNKVLLESKIATLEAVKGIVEEVMSEEQDSFDSKSERWQEGDRGEEAQGVLDSLEGLIDSLEEIIGEIEELTTG